MSRQITPRGLTNTLPKTPRAGFKSITAKPFGSSPPIWKQKPVPAEDNVHSFTCVSLLKPLKGSLQRLPMLELYPNNDNPRSSSARLSETCRHCLYSYNVWAIVPSWHNIKVYTTTLFNISKYSGSKTGTDALNICIILSVFCQHLLVELKCY